MRRKSLPDDQLSFPEQSIACQKSLAFCPYAMEMQAGKRECPSRKLKPSRLSLSPAAAGTGITGRTATGDSWPEQRMRK